MTDKIVTNKLLHDQIKNYIIEQLKYAPNNSDDDKQKIINACKNALKKISDQYSCSVSSVKIAEDTEEERIVREVMEESNTDIRIEAEVQFPTPFTRITIHYDIPMTDRHSRSSPRRRSSSK